MKLSNIKAKANKEKQILVIHVLKCALLSLDIIQQKQTFLPPFLKKHTQHSLSYFSFAQTISTAVFSCSISLALLLFHISLLLFYIYTHTHTHIYVTFLLLFIIFLHSLKLQRNRLIVQKVYVCGRRIRKSSHTPPSF